MVLKYGAIPFTGYGISNITVMQENATNTNKIGATTQIYSYHTVLPY